MKKLPLIELIPDGKRLRTDFLGNAFCPSRPRFAEAWEVFEAAYNAEREGSPGERIVGVVPNGGCGADIFANITTVRDPGKFPSVVTAGGYQEYFLTGFLEDTAKHLWFAPSEMPYAPNALFDGLDLRDPKGIFNIYGAMPYVIMVNHKKRGGRPVPRRISDLTNPAYKNSLGVLYAPDDVTELLLLEIWKEQGEAGIRALARNIGMASDKFALAESIVGRQDGCCVYIMSLFFAQAVPKREHIEIVWPEDGALFCPLYFIRKKESAARQDAIIDFLYGEQLGGTLADGCFPHVHPKAMGRLPKGARFRWVGWDYLYEKNFVERVREIERIYYDEKSRIGKRAKAFLKNAV
jgi:ABC-type Fe3+ transport system substrate-binding protein